MSELLQVLSNINAMVAEEESSNTCESYYASLLEAKRSIEISLNICNN